MRHFYTKELLSNAYLVNGARVPFESLANNRGALALDDTLPQHKPLISALDQAAAQGRGGINKVSEAEYLKKKQLNPLLSTPSKRKSPLDAPLRIMPTQAPRVQNARPGAVPAVVNPPTPPPPAQPAASPREQHIAERVRARREYKPATGRASKVKEQSLPEPPK